MVFTSYTSSAGSRMANPVLVNRQLQEMRTVMERMRQLQFLEEQSTTHLHELASRINGKSHRTIVAKKKIYWIRTVAKRMHAIHETSDPILVQKLARIAHES